MKEVRRILIIRADRIGDLTLTIPMAAAVKKFNPKIEVQFLVRKYAHDLLYRHPFIERSHCLIEEKGKIKIIQNAALLKKEKIDACVVASPSFQIYLICFLAGIKLRIGTGYRWYSFLINRKVYQHRKLAEMHELNYNMNLLKPLGFSELINENNVIFNIKINEESEQRIENEFQKENIDKRKPIFIIHPGSGGSAIDLPLNRFKELITAALNLDCNIILTGDKKEISICEKLVINQKIINLSGRFDLGELIALISKADALIANSTGPIHIAAALGKYTIGFYPKIKVCSAKRWGPYTNKKFVFEPEIACSNCSKTQCERLSCMNYINLKEVYNAMEKIIQEIKSKRSQI